MIVCRGIVMDNLSRSYSIATLANGSFLKSYCISSVLRNRVGLSACNL